MSGPRALCECEQCVEPAPLGDKCEMCGVRPLPGDILCRRCRIRFDLRDPVMERTAQDAILQNMEAAKRLRRMMK